MEDEAFEHYLKAGEVIQDARERAREIATPGKNLKDIAEELETLIRDRGLKPAFPVNISINEAAAHYTPGVEEDRVVKEDDVVKIDIGAQSNGYIADTALTVNPSGKHEEMIETVEEVLEKALEFVEPGKSVGEFGTFVEEQVPEKYQVVTNLTGHYLAQNTQHAGVSIPNVVNDSHHAFQEGDAFAIEPFITDGSGKVKEGGGGNIYRLENDRNVRGRMERKLLKEIRGFQGLPFTPRWFSSFSGREKMALQRLVDSGAVHSYPVLKELNDGLVAQAEHTVVLRDGEKFVTTRR